MLLISLDYLPRCARDDPPRRAERFFDYAFLSPPLWNRFITAARTYSDASFIVNFCTRGTSRRCQRLSCSARCILSPAATLRTTYIPAGVRLKTFFENFRWCAERALRRETAANFPVVTFESPFERTFHDLWTINQRQTQDQTPVPFKLMTSTIGFTGPRGKKKEGKVSRAFV